ncbi:MAG TPA: sigma 54-interacting transcriptional regulator [Kofleriaceae bacterium]|nr:sigma 54-interacting transcriptional regulator [Kofleriaceae bacterium]
MAGDSPAQDTTIRPSKRPAPTAEPAAPWLTVLWHPLPDRIGQIAALPARLSRLEPEFAAPGSTVRGPLGDPHLSRTAIALTALPGGGVRIEAPEVAELMVDGAPVGAPGTAIDLPAAALVRGAVLELAGRVALLLHLRRPPRAPDPARIDDLIGASDAIEALRDDIARVAALDAPVLIGGETGSGKEHVARALHARSGRAGGPFVAVNMATLAPAMAAAQLFGHARGAFTGAERARAGLFEEADRGTLFLDEIADAPPEVQAMLLRTLETGELRPVGGDAARRIDVRVIAASDADLGDPAELRPQLYHRLAGYRIAVPALRDRPDDLGRLLAHFVARELAAPPVPAPGDPAWLPAAALRAYVRHGWPGNVRELANAARHLAIHGRTGPIALATAVAPLGAPPAEPALAAAPREITDDVLIATLAAQRWKPGAAAAALGISKTTLYALIERCPAIRKARDVERGELEACRAATGGDLDAMSARLQVSRRGLQLRMRELGM